MTRKNVNPAPTSSSQYDLEPMIVSATLLPRFARRLRMMALQEERTVEAVAARLIACAMVPDPKERRRMVDFDLRDARVSS